MRQIGQLQNLVAEKAAPAADSSHWRDESRSGPGTLGAVIDDNRDTIMATWRPVRHFRPFSGQTTQGGEGSSASNDDVSEHLPLTNMFPASISSK
jgi:hypothetical protein